MIHHNQDSERQEVFRSKRVQKTTVTIIKGEPAIKVKYSISLLVAAMALLALSGYVHACACFEKLAKKSYVFKTYLKGDDIKIESKDGAVVLTGTVSEEFHKSLAQETVASLPGVKSVDNRLEVKGVRPAEKSDAWISTKVKTTLLFHRSVSAMTEVNAKDGIVTLKGDVDNQTQKDLTTEYVKDVDGVKEVKNEMVVSKTLKKTHDTVGEKIDDASITALVKMTLLFHRSTSAINTKVETKHGVVTVGGTAGNATEKDLVSKLVNDAKGVKNVKNQMTIEESK